MLVENYNHPSIVERSGDGGYTWDRITFANGYTASIVCGPGTYGGCDGLLEIAVINEDGEIDYSTPVTNDVVGYLTVEEATKILDQIAVLKVRDSQTSAADEEV
jgi:hypothetical protein